MDVTRPRLTKRLIDDTAADPEKPVRLWDTEERGLHLLISPGGTKSWYFTYRNSQKQQRILKLGRYPAMTPDAARKAAVAARGAVNRGDDPAEQKKAGSVKATTMAELCDRFLAEHVALKLKPRTQVEYKRIVERHIRPTFGAKGIDEVTFGDVASFHAAMASTPRQANISVRVLSKMMALAIRWGLRTDRHNPASGVGLFRERKRERYLSGPELARLWAVLDERDRAGLEREIVLAIRLLLMTGRRLSEILGLRWDYLDLESGLMRLPDSKVGAKTYPLSPPVVGLLAAAKARQQADLAEAATADKVRLQHHATDYVVRGRVPERPLVNLQKAWRRIRDVAGIGDVRIHDLRHTYASIAAAEGKDLLRIKEMLGHTNIQTTQRYAHLIDSAVRASVDDVGAAIMTLVGQGNKSKDENVAGHD